MFVGKRKAFGIKFQNEENGGEGSSGAGGAAAVDMNNPVIKAAMQAAIDAEVAGLKAKNQELIGKLQKAPKVDSVELEALLELKKKVDANEEMKLLSEGKLEEVLNRRNEAWKRDTETQIQARDAKITEYENLVKAKDERLKALTVDHQVREEYAGLDFEPAALDDILLQARMVFTMDSDGKVTPRDQDGYLLMGKDGKTPLKPREWLEGLAEKKTYLRRPSKGSGAAPSKGGARGFDASKASSTQLIAEGLRQRGLQR